MGSSPPRRAPLRPVSRSASRRRRACSTWRAALVRDRRPPGGGVHFDLPILAPGTWAPGHGRQSLRPGGHGATPRYGFLSLGVGPHPSREFLAPLLAGSAGWGGPTASPWPGAITVASPQVLVNLCCWGIAPRRRPCCGGAPAGGRGLRHRPPGRRPGRPGLAQGGRRPGEPAFAPAVEAHLRPRPRVAAGQALARTAWSAPPWTSPTAGHRPGPPGRRLAPWGRGAGRTPAHRPSDPPPGRGAGRRFPGLALGGGEDFELLFTCAPPAVDELARAVAAAEPGLAVTRVGTLLAAKGGPA